MHARCNDKFSYSYSRIVALDVFPKNPEFWRQPLAAKYDMTYEARWRVEQAIASGAIADIQPAFTVGHRRIYERRALDRALALRKFGNDVARARKHRVTGGFPTAPLHEAPVAARMPPVPMPHAYEMAWAENRARDRINRPTPKKKLRQRPPVKDELNELTWCDVAPGLCDLLGGEHDVKA